jgi:hypothetical protein
MLWVSLDCAHPTEAQTSVVKVLLSVSQNNWPDDRSRATRVWRFPEEFGTAREATDRLLDVPTRGTSSECMGLGNPPIHFTGLLTATEGDEIFHPAVRKIRVLLCRNAEANVISNPLSAL